VTFDANGGGSGTMDNEDLVNGIAKALTANAFTRSGFTFLGWNTASDGSGTAYTDGQSVSGLSETAGATVTLYAQWIAASSSGGCSTWVSAPWRPSSWQVRRSSS
jgi:hypothetical protein